LERMYGRQAERRRRLRTAERNLTSMTSSHGTKIIECCKINTKVAKGNYCRKHALKPRVCIATIILGRNIRNTWFLRNGLLTAKNFCHSSFLAAASLFLWRSPISCSEEYVREFRKNQPTISRANIITASIHMLSVSACIRTGNNQFSLGISSAASSAGSRQTCKSDAQHSSRLQSP